MKNLIIQYYIDINLYTQPNFNNLGPSPAEQYSSHSFQLYCKKYGIDYLKITKPRLSFKHPTWERFDLWMDRSWWDKYDQILYVDSDVFALPHAPNIFEKYSNLETFKGAEYTKFRRTDAVGAKALVHNNPLLSDIPGDLIQKKSIQPGVFMLNKKSSEQMLPYISDYKNMSDKKVTSKIVPVYSGDDGFLAVRKLEDVIVDALLNVYGGRIDGYKVQPGDVADNVTMKIVFPLCDKQGNASLWGYFIAVA